MNTALTASLGLGEAATPPLRVYLATIGEDEAHRAALGHFRGLAAADAIGTHLLTDDPAAADAILFIDLHQHPRDPFLRGLRRHPLVRAHAQKVRVYDERDAPFFTFPGIYVSATRQAAARRPIVGGPFVSLSSVLPDRAVRPQVLFSFRGTVTHPIRREVLALTHPRARIEEIRSASPVVADTTDRGDFDAMIADSKFVLCPRGHGASSFRLYETLRAGRVPVIISDAFLTPPGVDWSRCAVRVRERDIGGIPALLEDLEANWPEMSGLAARVFDATFARDRIWHYYATSLAGLEGTRPSAAPWWAQRAALRVGVRRAKGRLRRSGRADEANAPMCEP